MHELQAAIAALWDDAQPRLLERVAALEAAAAGGRLEGADVHAHTLAGTLGAFGLADAVSFARDAERALESRDRAALRVAARSLRFAVESGPTAAR